MQHRLFFRVFFLVVMSLLLACAPYCSEALADDTQMMTLGATSTDRFAITEKTWPAAVGQADVCLWKDDAHTAVTITIDDNNAPDHAWWTQTCETYGIKVTWFVITCMVETNPGFSGTWDGFRALDALGHDVQSHTVTHLSFDRGFDPNDPLHDITAEYANSISDIESQISGKEVITLAYPGGTNSSYNDQAVAAQYYIAARGTAGTINSVNKVNYINTNSVGSGLYITNPSAAWTQLINLFDPTAYRTFNYRGWYCTHYHGVDDTAKARITAGLDYLAQKDQEVGVWVGLFREVALYGQERDSATLTVDSVTDNSIAFTVTDTMSDLYYTFPLTVKVHIPDAWSSCQAVQGNVTSQCEILEHEGSKFALVPAVPDKGQVTISQAQSPKAGDTNGDGVVNLDDFITLRQNYGIQSGATWSQGDFNGDGAINLDDFIMLKQNYGL